MHPLLAQSHTLKVPFSHNWMGSRVLPSNYSDLSAIRNWLRLFKEQRKKLCFCFGNVLLGGSVALWCCSVSSAFTSPWALSFIQKKKTQKKTPQKNPQQNNRRIYKPFPSSYASLSKCGSLPLNFNANESHPRKCMGHCLVMLMKPPSLSVQATSVSRTDSGRKMAFSQLESNTWRRQAMGPTCGLLGGPDARKFLALPQNQNYIYFHFPNSRHHAAPMLSQPHHVPTQGVLGELVVRESHFLSHYFVCCSSWPSHRAYFPLPVHFSVPPSLPLMSVTRYKSGYLNFLSF